MLLYAGRDGTLPVHLLTGRANFRFEALTVAATLRHLGFFIAMAGLSAVVVRSMIAWGPIDRPDARKAHAQPVPKGGGVGVVVAFLVGIALLYATAGFARLADPYFRGLIVASVAMAGVAWLDDVREWPFTIKLGAQIGAAVLAVGSGLWVDTLNLPGVGPVGLGWVGVPLSLGWILFATNAVNFMDGLNGLVAGSCALASLVLAGLAAGMGGWFVYAAGGLLGAGLLGFLPFNFPRARIFLGDVGSQFCGFVLAVLTVAAGRFQGVELSVLLVPMLLMGLLYDVAFTLIRRAIAGERVTQPHRSHLYQIAHRSGMAAARISLMHFGFVGWGALCCLAFLGSAGVWKPLAVLAVIVPQLGWTAFVIRRGRSLERW